MRVFNFELFKGRFFLKVYDDRCMLLDVRIFFVVLLIILGGMCVWRYVSVLVDVLFIVGEICRVYVIVNMEVWCFVGWC